jgi:hypothetical protein
VPVVARLFTTGSSTWGGLERPGLLRPRPALAVNLDGLTFDEVRPLLDKALAEGAG